MFIYPALATRTLTTLCTLLPQSVIGVGTPAAVPRSPAATELTAQEWIDIRAVIEAGRHAVHAGSNGFVARNPGQAWLANFDGRGVLVEPDHGNWTWGLELVHYGFADGDRVVPEAATVRHDGGRMTYAWSESLEEWYVNDTRGLEHGYTLRERPATAPAEAEGPLAFTLDIRGELRAEVTGSGRSLRFLDAEGSPALTYTGLTVFDADSHELDARFELAGDRVRLVIDEAAARYPLTIDPIVQQAYLKASNTDANDRFGAVMDLSGNTLVVGALNEDSRASGVNGNESDNSLLAAGAAYVFVRTGSTWAQQAYLKPSNPGWKDFFGLSVAISGDTVVVGADHERSSAKGVGGNEYDNSQFGAGAVYVFQRSGSSWTQQAYVKASNTNDGDYFGSSVDIDGDTLVVGAWGESSNSTGVNGGENNNGKLRSGAAYVFTRSGTQWSQQAYLKASNTDAKDRFGENVAIAGNTIVVGAASEDSLATGVNGNGANNVFKDSGAAYVFAYDGTAWSQQAYLKASNTAKGDNFGDSVAVHGNTVLVGATGDNSSSPGVNGDQFDNGAVGAGAAFVFVRNGSTWSQQAYLKASNPGVNDAFGTSLALSSDRAVVGAPREGGSSKGADGNQADEGAPESGAAYTFERVGGELGGTWIPGSYLKASNTNRGDHYGTGVTISNTTVVLGADRESSAATGVDGPQGDKSALFAGAAYALDLAAPCGVTRYGAYAGANFADIYASKAPAAGGLMTLELSGFSADGTAFVLLSAAPASIPIAGGTLLVDPSQSILGPGEVLPVAIVAGSGQLVLHVPVSAAGLVLYGQAGMLDAGQPLGIALTNGLDIAICP